MVRNGDVPFESEADQLNEIPIFEQPETRRTFIKQVAEPALLL